MGTRRRKHIGGEKNHHTGLAAHPDSSQAHHDLTVPMRRHGYTHGAQSAQSQSQANQAHSVKTQMKANNSLHGGGGGDRIPVVQPAPPPPNKGGHLVVNSNAQSMQGSKHLASAKVNASGDSAVYAAGNPANPHTQGGGRVRRGRLRRPGRRKTRGRRNQRARRLRHTRRSRRRRRRGTRRGGTRRGGARRGGAHRQSKRQTGKPSGRPCICVTHGDEYPCYSPSRTPERCKAEVRAFRKKMEAFKQRRK